MKYKIESWPIKKLIKLYEDGKLNLNPPYQRNDIWRRIEKERLIDSIKVGYPLPTFFLHEKSKENFDMVDGQQRTRTLLGFYKCILSDLEKKYYKDYNDHDKNYFFDEYQLVVVILYNVKESESLSDFYSRVNKYGSKLNRPEINKAQYMNTPMQNLIEELADSKEFKSLNLFTESSLSRMNDTDFIAELLTLIHKGITDKKLDVDRLYKDSDFDKISENIKKRFQEILTHFVRFNKIYTISKTRYRQRNDFYTFFGFIKDNPSLKLETLDYFYKFLILIDTDITPTNGNCSAFMQYATNCVSQSNSKKAREDRLSFFNSLLLNTDPYPLKDKDDANLPVLGEVLNYYKLDENNLFKIENFYLIKIDDLRLKRENLIKFE